MNILYKFLKLNFWKKSYYILVFIFIITGITGFAQIFDIYLDQSDIPKITSISQPMGQTKQEYIAKKDNMVQQVAIETLQ